MAQWNSLQLNRGGVSENPASYEDDSKHQFCLVFKVGYIKESEFGLAGVFHSPNLDRNVVVIPFAHLLIKAMSSVSILPWLKCRFRVLFHVSSYVSRFVLFFSSIPCIKHEAIDVFIMLDYAFSPQVFLGERQHWSIISMLSDIAIDAKVIFPSLITFIVFPLIYLVHSLTSYLLESQDELEQILLISKLQYFIYHQHTMDFTVISGGHNTFNKLRGGGVQRINRVL